jgi:protein-tyrosine phosphatase
MQNRNAKSTQSVLFLCTGNYYRSRFAEILFNWHATERGLTWKADSRGLAIDACNVGPISRHTMASLKSRGITSDTCARFPISLTEADLAAADRVIAVKEHEHRPLVERKFPMWCDRIEYWHVHDIDYATPEVAIPHLEREVVALLERIARLAA